MVKWPGNRISFHLSLFTFRFMVLLPSYPHTLSALWGLISCVYQLHMWINVPGGEHMLPYAFGVALGVPTISIRRIRHYSLPLLHCGREEAVHLNR